jgi:hypothetical protein
LCAALGQFEEVRRVLRHDSRGYRITLSLDKGDAELVADRIQVAWMLLSEVRTGEQSISTLGALPANRSVISPSWYQYQNLLSSAP